MAIWNCFSVQTGRNKKGNDMPRKTATGIPKALLVRLERPVQPFQTDELKHTTFGVSIPRGVTERVELDLKVRAHESPISGSEMPEIACEGEDKLEELDKDLSSIKRDLSDFDLQARATKATSGTEDPLSTSRGLSDVNVVFRQESIDMKFESRHDSDPEVRKTKFWASPMLKQSCSNMEIRHGLKKAAGKLSPTQESQSFEEFRQLARRMEDDVNYREGSPALIHTRVDERVNDLSVESGIPDDDYNKHDENGCEENIGFTPFPETAQDSGHHSVQYPEPNLKGEEILHANSLIPSLNSSSSVAHISGAGLKVIPALSHFSNLKSVNLSCNSIVRITPGSLPKGLHDVNLSRNKIGTIEGLRELTRLRILDLSYNRIARIGYGLSNSTLIKELYLGGNKISEIEGLHRMLKLTVLDLSFNKITTNKSLGQLVANYNSLLALNLLGNTIQNNISDEQLRKTVCSLLPKLVYLNKQPLKQQRTLDLATDSVAKAALGTGGGRASARRKMSGKRANLIGSGHGSGPSTSSVHKRSEPGRQKKGKNKINNHSYRL